MDLLCQSLVLACICILLMWLLLRGVLKVGEVMSKRRGKGIPEIINVNGSLYHAITFLVHSKYPDGTPRLVGLIKDNHEIELEGHEEFMIAYVPRVMLKDKE